ncbi:MAG TPA: hypothetical protein VFM48_08860 [Aquabacterium sp.]|nr:hypothetical protein [Aquabacterium sp.]
MIHHFARALFLRSQTNKAAPRISANAHVGMSSSGVINARSIVRPAATRTVSRMPMHHLRICSDPSDARRTVIAGRFAEVCAALDQMVREQEATA